MTHTNQLINETSPYLLQHAHNPVNWLPFGPEAFRKASSANKPMLISIGYSACHWCHVMEHESFENEEIAAVMNEHFVCVKVDREERPDVDHVFMDAVQQIHRQGGWPLNCFALPDGRPFWGGTYFRPEQWNELLHNIAELYQNRYLELEQQAGNLAEGVAAQNKMISGISAEASETIDFESVFSRLYASFDHQKGGLKGAPKFPMPVVLQFLFQYAFMYNDHKATKILDLTLQKIACGGIYDQAGGGFARYSTDSDWKVPHFEKMLYDNAQLIRIYTSSFQLNGDLLSKDVVEQTIDFIFRELSADEGFFFSALDADSEGEEGLFYTWTTPEFNDALGHYAPLAAEYFGVDHDGLWENGRNILLRHENNELFAQQHYLSLEELTSLIAYCRKQLLQQRSQRIRPALDDKMLVSWNALIISALTDASIAFDRNDYLESALKTAHFIVSRLKRPDGGLFHTWKNGSAPIHAFLDSYAFCIEAFIKLYSVTADELWLEEAQQLTRYSLLNLYDSDSGLFWYSENNDEHVFARKTEVHDGVVPSGNSVMAGVLAILGIFMNDAGYVSKSKHMIQVMAKQIEQYPAAYANWGSVALLLDREPYVMAVIGTDCERVLKNLLKCNHGSTLIFGSNQKSTLPYFADRFVEGKTLIYICSGTFCYKPVETVDEAYALINNNRESPPHS